MDMRTNIKLSGIVITGPEGVSEVASASQLSIYSLDGVIGMCLSRRDGKEHRVELNLTKDQASFLGKSLIALADNVEVDDKPDGLREGGCALFEGKKCKIKALSRSTAQIVISGYDYSDNPAYPYHNVSRKKLLPIYCFA